MTTLPARCPVRRCGTSRRHLVRLHRAHRPLACWSWGRTICRCGGMILG
jgi:hypothetical protein